MIGRYKSPPFDLGKGYTVEFRFADGRMDAEWTPRMPHGRHARAIMPAYRAARHRFLSKLAETLGITIAVVDA